MPRNLKSFKNPSTEYKHFKPTYFRRLSTYSASLRLNPSLLHGFHHSNNAGACIQFFENISEVKLNTMLRD